ncbi:DUF1963 domain-containing protein [Promicromonospora umidemergens]|uniref:DUF1963 domain-containing protein n=1 Tax=Promicromonospora umidemergens TaxID=629679 RepID=UPI0020A4909D|nr:DUF1963 domain-containing protein [Promicromonospora umidemergens]
MTDDELREMLIPFRTQAVEEGYPWEDIDPLPAEEVDRWISNVRPCAVLTGGGDGTVAGAFGGPLLLPAEVPDPEYPYLASVDLAALPKDATDLPLPPDGLLLLFASLDEPDGEGNYGQAIYVPVGTPVEERDKNTWKGYPGDDHYQKIVDSYPQGELRARTEPDLPYHSLPGFPNAEELVAVWCDASGRSGHLQVGGYADQEDSDPDPLERLASSAVHEVKRGRWGDGEPVSGAVEDWVLLAHWNPNISGREGADVQWGIQRADLEARRFDRAFSTVYWNP